MARHYQPVPVHDKQPAAARPDRPVQAPAQARRCPGAAAQLEAVHRTLRRGPVLQLQPGAPAATRQAGAPSRTGIPEPLKSGVEALSGVSLDAARVHYNSSRPAQLDALAYAQGSDIHLAPGQERHLPHEAWHLVQQAQGRVKPTLQLKGGIPINDDIGLEREADAMGARALLASRSDRSSAARESSRSVDSRRTPGSAAPVQRIVGDYKAKTLGDSFVVMKGLTDKQKIAMQALHDDHTKTYTIDEARQLVGAAPLDPDKSSSSSSSPPFPFRYDKSGKPTMETISTGFEGFVQYPVGGFPSREGTSEQQSFALGHGKQDLPSYTKRKVTQIAVQEGISPNAAAKALKLPCPEKLSWEWLHLVAFSIKQTHVSNLSQASMLLIGKTDQPQQIKENMVLGTAAANTEMLSFETLIKEALKSNPTWKLNLTVQVSKQDFLYEDVGIPVGVVITYDFYFQTGDKTYTSPFVVAFDPRKHDKPATKSFGELKSAFSEALKYQTTLKEPLKGPSTEHMGEVD